MAFVRKFPVTTLLVNLCLLLLFSFVTLRSPSTVAENQVGYGYRVICVNQVMNGDALIADLDLIKRTDVYGPDIERLQLTVRYDNQDRIRVHITDANTLRWEVPPDLIPRATSQELKSLRNTTYSPDSSKAACRNLRLPEIQNPTIPLQNPDHPLEFSYTTEIFGFAITRRSNGEVLFNSTPSVSTANGLSNNLVFKDQYIELSTQLPKDAALFGLGEGTHSSGLRLAKGNTYTLWATDIGSYRTDIDLYGSYPIYIDVRKGGLAHGVQLVNSNGMDCVYGEDGLTFKMIGGVLDLYFFAGPSPRKVLDQYTLFVGRPAPMPFWTLGFHQSRYGYKTLKEVETVVAKYKEIGLPLESMWSDIDYMDRFRDFTIDPDTYPPVEFRKFVDTLHANNQKFTMIVDPGIKVEDSYPPYVRGKELDIFLKTESGEEYLGQVWPGAVHYPDFLHPKAKQWWTKEISEFYKVMPFDGLWLDMNEPSNFCSGPNCYYPPDVVCPEALDWCCMVCDNTNVSRWDRPPYRITNTWNKELYEKTVTMTARHYNDVKHYDAHNIYGFSQTVATFKALKEVTKKRPFVMSRSLYPGSGASAAHWSGDNGASWNDLRYSIASILNSGLFGIPMVGADICGFIPATWEELCNRWIQVGAFYPFARDHSDVHFGPQELYLWKSVTHSARKVLPLRYKLLPFMYTLLHEAHMTGAPVARALFFVFPEDPTTYDVSDQFLLGDAILVSPVVSEGQTSVNAYIPKGNWWNLFNWSPIHSNGSYYKLDAPWDTINVHVRSGFILPMQEYANTTALVRSSPVTLLVVFSGVEQESASGELFLDDDTEIGMEIRPKTSTHIKFVAAKSASRGSVRSTVRYGEWAEQQGLYVHKIVLVGLMTPASSLLIDGAPSPDIVTLNFDKASSMQEISGLRLSAGKDFEVAWTSTTHAVDSIATSLWQLSCLHSN